GTREGVHRVGPGGTPAGRWLAAVVFKDPRSAELLGNRVAAFSCGSDMGNSELLAAFIPQHGPPHGFKADRLIRVDAVSCGRFRMFVWRRYCIKSPKAIWPERCRFPAVRLYGGRLSDARHGFRR